GMVRCSDAGTASSHAAAAGGVKSSLGRCAASVIVVGSPPLRSSGYARRAVFALPVMVDATLTAGGYYLVIVDATLTAAGATLGDLRSAPKRAAGSAQI